MKDQVVRNLEIIGEALNQLDKTLKKLPCFYRETADLRNKMVHDYSGVDYVTI